MRHVPLLLLVLSCIISPCLAQSDLYDEGTLRTIELSFSQSDYWTQLLNNKAAEIDISADLTMDGVTYSNIGIRFKGNSSYNSIPWSQKKPFKITMDSFVSGQDLLGYDKINLNNCFKDPTFCREVVSYHILRQYMPASKANFVKLVINGQNWGIYVNVQQVEKKMLGEWFDDNDGNRYKCDPVGGGPPGGSAMNWLGSTQLPYETSYELKTDPNPTTWLDLIDCCNQLNNSSNSQIYGNLDPIFAVDRALWMLAFNNVFSNLDSYSGSGHNYYLFQDNVNGRLQTLPWDLNESFGCFAQGYNSTTIKTMSPLMNSTNTSRPLIARLLSQPDLRDTYAAHIRTILDEWFDWNTIGSLVTQYQTLIDSEVQADTKKLYSYTLFQQGVTQDIGLNGGPGGLTIPGLQPFVTTRRTYLQNYWAIDRPAPTIASVVHTPSQPSDLEAVTVTANVTESTLGVGAVWVFWRTSGAFSRTTMYDDGLHGDGAAGDGTYGADIAPQGSGVPVDYYVGCRTLQPSMAKTFFPRGAEGAALGYTATAIPINGNLAINEILAKNDTGITDEMGEFEDWIEVLNTSSSPMVMDGLYITDDITDPTKWQVPSGYTLQPGESLLIWADDDETDGPLHTNFKLGGSGEEVAVFDTDGSTLLDYIMFGPQEDDISYGCLNDGGSTLVTFLSPTPGLLNEQNTCGVRAYSADDSTLHGIALDAPTGVVVGQTVSFEARQAPASSTVILAVAGSGANSALPATSVSLLLGAGAAPLAFAPADASGAVDFIYTLPNSPALAGVTAFLQAFAADSAGTLWASNAIEVIICP